MRRVFPPKGGRSRKERRIFRNKQMKYRRIGYILTFYNMPFTAENKENFPQKRAFRNKSRTKSGRTTCQHPPGNRLPARRQQVIRRQTTGHKQVIKRFSARFISIFIHFTKNRPYIVNIFTHINLQNLRFTHILKKATVSRMAGNHLSCQPKPQKSDRMIPAASHTTGRRSIQIRSRRALTSAE